MAKFNVAVTITGGRVVLTVGEATLYLTAPAGKILVMCINKIVDGCSVYTGDKPRPAVKAAWMRPI